MPMNGDSKRVWQHIHDLRSETQELCAKSSRLTAEVAWFCELAEEWARLRKLIDHDHPFAKEPTQPPALAVWVDALRGAE